eukprot:TRINITY_DN3527_c0_g6_i1.p1 TRINITY_DN3527_c0_g6~~TRINITY_DN3527_c0_g6_i1.p1  ORF type:complete len:101 (-),score=19.79 TRINITY_DN3527_c0_g6_i1:52-321(-)
MSKSHYHGIPAKASLEEMEEAKIAVNSRDGCAGILIKLKACRFETFYLPWKCTALSEAYHHCLNDDYQDRVKQYTIDKLKELDGDKKGL